MLNLLQLNLIEHLSIIFYLRQKLQNKKSVHVKNVICRMMCRNPADMMKLLSASVFPCY